MQVAFYKAPGNWVDKLIRKFTHGPYSHCEVVINGEGYTSTARDGGVRRKKIDFNDAETWELVEVPWAQVVDVTTYFSITTGTRYSVPLLILDQFFNFNVAKKGASFCSEWCATALSIPSPAVYNPNSLYDLLCFMRKAGT